MAQLVHHGNGLRHEIDAAPDLAVDLLDARAGAVLHQGLLEHRHVVAMAHQHRQLVAPGLLEELPRAVTEVGLHRGVPIPREVLEHPVGVEEHVRDRHGSRVRR